MEPDCDHKIPLHAQDIKNTASKWHLRDCKVFKSKFLTRVKFTKEFNPVEDFGHNFIQSGENKSGGSVSPLKSGNDRRSFEGGGGGGSRLLHECDCLVQVDRAAMSSAARPVNKNFVLKNHHHSVWMDESVH